MAVLQDIVRREDPALPDVLVGVAWVVVSQLERAGQVALQGVRPGVRLFLEPPFVPPGRRPVRLVEALARRGRLERAAAGRALDRLVATRGPGLVGHLAALVPVTDLVRRHVDLDALVAGVDLDAIAARIDLDQLLDRIDLTDVVIKRVDFDAVLQAVDLDAAVGTVDLDAILDRIDLEALANDVIAAVDLPELIRESSGSLASETVRNVRMASIDADRAVDRVIERLTGRRRHEAGDRQPGGAPT